MRLKTIYSTTPETHETMRQNYRPAATEFAYNCHQIEQRNF